MIYLVRHGETEFNREDRVQGRLDSPLTDLGKAQARAAGEVLLAHAPADPVDWILQASPLGRTRQTAAIIQPILRAPPPVFDDRLIEVSYGEMEGLTRAEVDVRWPQFKGLNGIFGQAPGGETFDELKLRVGAWLTDAEAASAHRPLVCIAHAGVIRTLRGLYLGLTLAEIRALDKPQHHIFVLTAGRIDRLEADALPSPTAGA